MAKREKTELERSLGEEKLQEQIKKLKIDIRLADQRLEERNKETVKREEVEKYYADYSNHLRTGLEKVAGRDAKLRIALGEAVKSAVTHAEESDRKRKREYEGKRASHVKEEQKRRSRKVNR